MRIRQKQIIPTDLSPMLQNSFGSLTLFRAQTNGKKKNIIQVMSIISTRRISLLLEVHYCEVRLRALLFGSKGTIRSYDNWWEFTRHAHVSARILPENKWEYPECNLNLKAWDYYPQI